MIRTMLFDLDGTIIDTNELIIQTFLQVLKGRVPGHFSSEHIIPHMGKPLADQFRLFTGRDDVDDLVAAYREYNLKMHDELVREFPYVKEVLEKLRAHGVRMGIVTTKMRQTTEKGLQLFGLDKYMETIVTIEDVTRPKPHPEPVLRALRSLGAVPEEAAMVGDSPCDIEAANSAGVTSIGAGWSLKGERALREARPDYIVRDMRELLQIVGVERDPV